MKSFVLGILFGAAIMVMLTGHNGILRGECKQVRHVSPRFVYTPQGCEIDWPQYAKVCHDLDSHGNHIIKTGF